jgi:urease accessory protein
MPAATIITMTTDTAGLVRLLTWLSPGFPTGGYAYSHGLEWAVEAGDIRDEAGLFAWLDDIVALGAARSDAILLRHAHRAAGDPAALAALEELAAAAPGRERRAETLGQGEAFNRAAAAWGAAPAPVAYPVAIGMLAARHGIAEDAACAGFLHAFTANLISAAVRLVPLGQSAGLRVLAALEPALLRITATTRTATLEELGTASLRADIAALRHETQYTRLFRS